MIEAKVEIHCPCHAGAILIAEPMVVCEKRDDSFYIQCCQCGRKYYLVAEGGK